jgi:hypothetical protein
MEKIITKILKFNPITFVFYFIILPFVSLIITGIMTFIGFFADFEFVFPLVLIVSVIGAFIYFSWVWGVVFYLENDKEEVSDIKFFKISYWIIFSWVMLIVIDNLDLEILKTPILLDNTIWTLIGIAVGIYILCVFGCYIYLSYFIAKRIIILRKNNSVPDFFFFAAAWCFPIGIPFLQAQLLKEKTLFDLIYKR